MAEKNWQVAIDVKLSGESWQFNLTSTEQQVLGMLRIGWGAFEKKLRELAEARPGERPYGLVDEAIVLLRCLVFGRLEEHYGKFINIRRV